MAQSITSWRQLSLLQPSIAVVRLTAGFDGPRGTLTWGTAIYEGTDEDLVAMEATHSNLTRDALERNLHLLGHDLRRVLGVVGPF